GRRGFRVAHGTAEQGAQLVEMAALVDALATGTPALATPAAVAELRRRPQQRYWLLEDLQAVLERAALGGPVLVALDDLHWADSGGGNAFALAELLAGLREEQLVDVRGGSASLVADRLPVRVRDTMAERLARLSPLGRQVMTAAAVLERRFTREELAQMLDRPA